MDWLSLLTFKSAKNPELAPHAYLAYLLFWTFLVGLFVLFVFPVIGNNFGFVVIGLMISVFVYLVWYFHQKDLFAD